MAALFRRRAASEAPAVYLSTAPPELPEGLSYESKDGVLVARNTSKRKSMVTKAVTMNATWKPRWFVLSGDSLRCYTHRQDGSQPELRGYHQLQSCIVVGELEPRELKDKSVPKHALMATFKIVSKGGQPPPLYVHAVDEQEKLRWVEAIMQNIYLASNPRGGRFAEAGLPPPQTAGGARSPTGAFGSSGVSGGGGSSDSVTDAARPRAQTTMLGGMAQQRQSTEEGIAPPRNWGAKKGAFPPPPPPRKAASDTQLASTRHRAATEANGSREAGRRGSATRQAIVHAFAPWTGAWVQRRNSQRSSERRSSDGEPIAPPAVDPGGRGGGKARRGGGVGRDTVPARSNRAQSTPALSPDRDRSSMADDGDESSEEERDGAEASASWLNRRRGSLLGRAATVGNLFAGGGRRSSRGDADSSFSRQSWPDAPPPRAGAAEQPAPVSSGPSRWPSGRMRQSTTASNDAASTISHSVEGGVRGRASIFEVRPPRPGAAEQPAPVSSGPSRWPSGRMRQSTTASNDAASTISHSVEGGVRGRASIFERQPPAHEGGDISSVAGMQLKLRDPRPAATEAYSPRGREKMQSTSL